MAVLIVTGVTGLGIREILAVESMYEESKETYGELSDRLKERGLKSVWVVVSDAHAGLKALVAERLKQIGHQPDKETALQLATMLTTESPELFPKAVETLGDGLEDSLQFYAFPRFNSRRISSTNMQERLHKEIRRRSRVVGIFPSVDSYLRLVAAYLIEYADDWSTSRACIHPKDIQDQEAELETGA